MPKKTCMVCNQTFDIAEMATLVICRACMLSLSPEQKEELKVITKKGVPGQIVGMVFMFTAVIFIAMNLFSGLSMFYLLIGTVCMLVGSIVNLSVANFVKSQQKEYLSRIRDTLPRDGGDQPPEGLRFE